MKTYVNPQKAAALLPAVAYTRLSQDRNGLMQGVQRQEEDCRAHAERRGWSIEEVYQDDDLSAFTGKPRPDYNRLLDDMRAGRVKRIVVYDVDRLVRRMRDLVEFIDTANAHGVELATISGDIDLSSGTGRFIAHVMGARSEMESEDRVRRIRRTALQAAREGKLSGGGSRQFGREDDGATIRPSEAKIVREMARRVRGGESLRSIARDLQEREIPTVSGRPWRAGAVKRILASGRTAAVRLHHGEVVAELVDVKPIIKRREWERLQAVLDGTRRPPPGHSARSYLLTGLTYCGRDGCGARLSARPRDDGRRAYTCARDYGGCGRIGRLAEPVEAFVVEVALQWCERPSALAALRRAAGSDAEQDELLGRLAEDEAELAELDHRAYVLRDLPKTRYARLAGDLEARIQHTKARLRSLETSTVLTDVEPGTVRARWAEEGFGWRRALLFAVLERVTLLPCVRGRRAFDPTKVVPLLRAEADS